MCRRQDHGTQPLPSMISPPKLDNKLGLCPRSTGVCALRVTGELDLILYSEDLLESATDVLKNLPALSRTPALGERVTRDALAGSPCPQTNSIESLADIDHDTHDLVVTLILERLADGR